MGLANQDEVKLKPHPKLSPGAQAAKDRAKKNAEAVAEPAEGDGTGATAPDAERDNTPAGKAARLVLKGVRDNLERNFPKAMAYLDRGDASPEAAASSLEEISDLLFKAAAFCSARSIVLRHGSGEANPMLQVSARNIRSECMEGVSALEEACHIPHSWKRIEEKLSEGLKIAKAVQVMLGQEGMSLYTREEAPLADTEGNPLVPKKDRG